MALFLNTAPGFSCTIKDKPSDFIVNEIDTSGNVISLADDDRASIIDEPDPCDSISAEKVAETKPGKKKQEDAAPRRGLTDFGGALEDVFGSESLSMLHEFAADLDRRMEDGAAAAHGAAQALDEPAPIFVAMDKGAEFLRRLNETWGEWKEGERELWPEQDLLKAYRATCHHLVLLRWPWLKTHTLEGGGVGAGGANGAGAGAGVEAGGAAAAAPEKANSTPTPLLKVMRDPTFDLLAPLVPTSDLRALIRYTALSRTFCRGADRAGGMATGGQEVGGMKGGAQVEGRDEYVDVCIGADRGLRTQVHQASVSYVGVQV